MTGAGYARVGNQWNLIVATANNGVGRISSNGGAFRQVNFLDGFTSDFATVMGFGAPDSQSLAGKIDEVAFYNAELNQQHVNDLWNGGAGLFR